MSTRRIGLIGAGMMGAGMAKRLIGAGHDVRVLAHRNRGSVDALLAMGAREAADAVDLLRDCDVLLTCLPNADVVSDLTVQLVPAFRQDQIWIDTSTSRPETSKRLAEKLTAQGAAFADAPVTGGPPQAREGTLISLVGCAEADFAAVTEIAGTYSRAVRRFGAPGTGHAAKLLNNLVSQGTLVLLADAFQGAARLGVDARTLFDVMQMGAARSGTLEKAVGPALDGDYGGAQFSIANAAKDLRYARDLLTDATPDRTGLAAALTDRLQELVAQGHGDAFVSSMLKPETP